MKKTIALFLAAIGTGITTADIVNINWKEDNTADYQGTDSLSVVFTLNVVNLPSNESTNPIFTWKGDEISSYGSSFNMTYGIYFDGFYGDVYGTTPGKSSGTGLGATQIQGYTMAVIGYTFDNNELANTYIKLITSDGKIIDTTPKTSGKTREKINFKSLYKHESVENIYVYDTKLSPEEVAAAMEVLISSPTPPSTPESPAAPEPTTATLSLLALAGLAARRRRK